MEEKLTSEEILNRIKKQKNKLKKKGVKKIGLFGSYAKGKQKEGSDIDFLVEFDKISADNFFGLLFMLENMFKRKIDLIEINKLREELNSVKKEVEYVKV